jgi:hypothetical protein
MVTLLDRIHQKLPQVSQSVLERVWSILNDNELSELANEDDELYAEFDRWEAASDEDEVRIEAMLASKGV